MRESAMAIGGRLPIESAPLRGSQFEVIVQ
jgi:hypothetical protein